MSADAFDMTKLLGAFSMPGTPAPGTTPAAPSTPAPTPAPDAAAKAPVAFSAEQLAALAKIPGMESVVAGMVPVAPVVAADGTTAPVDDTTPLVQAAPGTDPRQAVLDLTAAAMRDAGAPPVTPEQIVAAQQASLDAGVSFNPIESVDALKATLAEIAGAPEPVIEPPAKGKGSRGGGKAKAATAGVAAVTPTGPASADLAPIISALRAAAAHHGLPVRVTFDFPVDD